MAVAGSLTLAASAAMADGKWHREWNDYQKSKNVIVMIPDGCDETVQTLARWYKGEDLEVDKMQNGAVKVHMANSVIPGSAAAATAFATGHKTTARFIGVGPRTEDLLAGFEPTADPYAPIASVIEAAQREGKSTGIISTSRVTHATPAAFAAHIHDRGMDNEIMEHMVYNNVDVVFGGGARHLIPKEDTYTTTFGETWGGKRTDGENLMQVLLDRGYQFVDSKAGMDAVTSGKVWGLFDDSHMNADINRQAFDPNEPSLAEMVNKAIEILSQNPRGFVLMVEGSQVDWAGHANDPIYMLTDFIAFDDAVKVANDFAKEDGQTVVMAFPDHNTGGMKIGHYDFPVGYTETTIDDLLDPLKGMKVTAGAVAGAISDMEGGITIENIKAGIQEWWGLTINDSDAQEILDYLNSDRTKYFDTAVAYVISKNYTVIGWTTHGHNGETVPFWMYGKKMPVGTIDNTELAYLAADAIGVNLKRATRKLYVDLDTTGLDYTIDRTDAENPVVVVNGAQLPVSKDYMMKNGNTFKLPGVTVLSTMANNECDEDDLECVSDLDDDKVYVSRKAVKLLRRF